MEFLTVFLSCFSAFFGAVLFLGIRHGNRKQNIWLAVFCIGLGGTILRSYMLFSGHYLRFPLFVETLDTARYLLCPALYFYIRTAADNRFRLRKYDLAHLIPPLLNTAERLHAHALESARAAHYLTQWLNGTLSGPAFWGDRVPRIVFFVYFCAFTFLCARYYLKNRTQIEQTSHFGRYYSAWIALYLLMTILLVILWGVCLVLLVLNGSFLPAFQILFFSIAGALLIWLLKLFSRPEILYRARPVKSDKKYPASGLNDHEADQCYARLRELMEKEEEYLNPDLNLQELAGKLNIHKNYLSQIINEKTGRT
ncbi:MAG: XRE family transcriptional regulator, partial [Desulfobacteraceae bacterium]